ncbi:constitutive coactivator of peroxisome proliferator-activated receptor gamma isoform X2 [Boleophthalmus pectinirostris]|nr:constitutive coactivator of peroxisome proliferator-activated receptor gamma isoform X2 [Boleophthalmus pectinirostris]XP_055010266.1 constitutive coactivator of peroxisome proliferator-activated receptor gamma isoform X2 [Boleophthalmus pectinirostris]
MACLRPWYSGKDWVSGGQWKEYMDILKSWVEAFTSAGIRLVFFFDGVVEEQKRPTWIKRRHRVNGDICKIFAHIKAYGEQPRGEMCVLPSGLATFTRFALKSLGQEVFCSVREADYEIASYAREHNCMGILGQDTDYIIFDSAPYLSSAKLRINSLTTVLYDRQRLCHTLGLAVFHLPLLACLLGNDVVSEEQMQPIRKDALAKYSKLNSTSYPGSQQQDIILAVSQFVRSCSESPDVLVTPSLKLSPVDKELLEKGVQSYLLSDQTKHLSSETTDHPVAVYQKYVSPTILQACREKHVAAEGFMVYSVVSEGMVECSNSLEDEEDTELLPQALVYKPCRQRMYGVLLLHTFSDVDINPPPIKEWFVYPGNPLKEPEMVPPTPLNMQCDHPGLDTLWFGEEEEISSLRRACFLAILDCQDFAELYGIIEEHLFITLCLVTYITLQVQTLSQEDVHAYLSQAVCLAHKSPQDIQQIKLPFLCSRAVQLGCLYVRGLSYLLGANCASGCPLTSEALMPWNSFDGRLFQSKYLSAHSRVEDLVLLDNDASCLSVFHTLRSKVKEVCLKKGRELQSKPRRCTPQFKTGEEPRHWGHTGGEGLGRGIHHSTEGWRGRREARRRYHLYENRGRQNRGHYPSTSQQHPDFYSQQYHNRGAFANRRDSRGRFSHRGRYHLAPRWSQPPAS